MSIFMLISCRALENVLKPIPSILAPIIGPSDSALWHLSGLEESIYKSRQAIHAETQALQILHALQAGRKLPLNTWEF